MHSTAAPKIFSWPFRAGSRFPPPRLCRESRDRRRNPGKRYFDPHTLIVMCAHREDIVLVIEDLGRDEHPMRSDMERGRVRVKLACLVSRRARFANRGDKGNSMPKFAERLARKVCPIRPARISIPRRPSLPWLSRRMRGSSATTNSTPRRPRRRGPRRKSFQDELLSRLARPGSGGDGPVDADRDQHGLARDHAALAHLLITGVEDEVRERLGKGARGKGVEAHVQALVDGGDGGGREGGRATPR